MARTGTKPKVLEPIARVELPVETEWRDIFYHPAPIVTQFYGRDSEAYWQTTWPGCTIEPVNEDLGFMRHLVQGIKVRITPPPDRMEHYAEPLATMHKAFCDAASTITWTVYPFKHGMTTGGPKFKWGGKVHSVLFDVYWNIGTGDQYKEWTPASWHQMLNRLLAVIENYPVRQESDLAGLKRELEAAVAVGR